VAGSREHSVETSNSIKGAGGGGISCIAECLLVSQEGLCSMVLVS
jgi:hypothetical protein